MDIFYNINKLANILFVINNGNLGTIGTICTNYSSHPNKYFHKNKMKFISLWEVSQKLEANLFLINYAKKGTANEDKVLFMQVTDVNEINITNPVKTIDIEFTREEFSIRFRALNARGKKN